MIQMIINRNNMTWQIVPFCTFRVSVHNDTIKYNIWTDYRFRRHSRALIGTKIGLYTSILWDYNVLLFKLRAWKDSIALVKWTWLFMFNNVWFPELSSWSISKSHYKGIPFCVEPKLVSIVYIHDFLQCICLTNKS